MDLFLVSADMGDTPMPIPFSILKEVEIQAHSGRSYEVRTGLAEFRFPKRLVLTPLSAATLREGSNRADLVDVLLTESREAHELSPQEIQRLGTGVVYSSLEAARAAVSSVSADEEFEVQNLVFLGEVRGAVEQRVTESLKKDLKAVQGEYYLARVKYEHSESPAIAICARVIGLRERVSVRNMIVRAFREQSLGDEQFDLVFLTRKQQVEIERVCQPFLSSR